MVDQINIPITVTDKGVGPELAKLKKVLEDFDTKVTTRNARQEMSTLNTVAEKVGREVGSTLRLLGVTGAFVGGGIVAGIAGAGNALANFARNSLQLRYTGESLGIAAEKLSQYAQAGQAAGVASGTAAAEVQGALTKIQEMGRYQQYGGKGMAVESPLYQAILANFKGPDSHLLADEILKTLGPENNIEAAFRLILTKMSDWAKDGNWAAVTAMRHVLGLSLGWQEASKFMDSFKGLLLPTKDQAQAFMVQLTHLQAAVGTLGNELGIALMPTFTNLVTELNTWLRGPDGQDFQNQMVAMAGSLENLPWDSIRTGVTAIGRDIRNAFPNIKQEIQTIERLIAIYEDVKARMAGTKQGHWPWMSDKPLAYPYGRETPETFSEQARRQRAQRRAPQQAPQPPEPAPQQPPRWYDKQQPQEQWPWNRSQTEEEKRKYGVLGSVLPGYKTYSDWYDRALTPAQPPPQRTPEQRPTAATPQEQPREAPAQPPPAPTTPVIPTEGGAGMVYPGSGRRRDIPQQPQPQPQPQQPPELPWWQRGRLNPFNPNNIRPISSLTGGTATDALMGGPGADMLEFSSVNRRSDTIRDKYRFTGLSGGEADGRTQFEFYEEQRGVVDLTDQMKDSVDELRRLNELLREGGDVARARRGGGPAGFGGGTGGGAAGGVPGAPGGPSGGATRGGGEETLAPLKMPTSPAEAASTVEEAVRRGYMRQGGGPGIGGPLTTDEKGRVNPESLKARLAELIADSPLNGYKPADAEKWGITTGSPQEWAAFMTKIAGNESSYNVNTVGDIGSFGTGSRGLFQLSQDDARNYGLNNGKPFTLEQLRDPETNIRAAIAIMNARVRAGGIMGAEGAQKYWAHGDTFRRIHPSDVATGWGGRRFSLAEIQQSLRGGVAQAGLASSPYVTEAQKGAGRSGPINEQLRAIYDYAAREAGVKVEVFSGSEVPGGFSSGTGRHTGGRTGDIYLRDPETGERIPVDDPRAIKFTEAAFRAGAQSGGAGVPVGGGRYDYMGRYGIDIGIAPGGRGGFRGAYRGSEAFRTAAARGLAQQQQFLAEQSARTETQVAGPGAPTVTLPSTKQADTPRRAPPIVLPGGSQGRTAAEENERAGRPFWQLGAAAPRMRRMVGTQGRAAAEENERAGRPFWKLGDPAVEAKDRENREGIRENIANSKQRGEANVKITMMKSRPDNTDIDNQLLSKVPITGKGQMRPTETINAHNEEE